MLFQDCLDPCMNTYFSARVRPIQQQWTFIDWPRIYSAFRSSPRAHEENSEHNGQPMIQLPSQYVTERKSGEVSPSRFKCGNS